MSTARPEETWIRLAGATPCNCVATCGDADDEEGVCKSLPRPPREPLVRIVMVPR